jgi:hypothetical protein
MITLGKTFREVLSKLTTENADILLKHIKESFEIEDGDPIEELLDAPTDEGDFSVGGFFYRVEDEDDILAMIEQSGCSDVRDTPDENTMHFDVAMYLDKAETVAMLMVCTADDGGDAYILCGEVLDEFPSIREHIFQTNEA